MKYHFELEINSELHNYRSAKVNCRLIINHNCDVEVNMLEANKVYIKKDYEGCIL